MRSTCLALFALALLIVLAWTDAPVEVQSAKDSDASESANSKIRFSLEQVSNRGPAKERINLNLPTRSYNWGGGERLEYRKGNQRIHVNLETWQESAIEEVRTPDTLTDTYTKYIADAFKLSAEDAKKQFNAARRRGLRTHGKTAMLKFRNRLLYKTGQDQVVEIIKPADGPFELQQFSPNGEAISFVRNNNLVTYSIPAGETNALTSDGNKNIFNGKLDWVYQEEIYGRGRFNAHWWSPDSKHIAFLRLDETEVDEFSLVDHIHPDKSENVRVETFKYPKAGRKNPIPQLGIYSLESRKTIWTDLSEYKGKEILIVRVHWSPTGTLTYQVQDRIQRWLHLNRADLSSGETTTLIKETSEDWVDVLGTPTWLADGTFLWESQRSGWNHIYHYKSDGNLIRPVTSGEWVMQRRVVPPGHDDTKVVPDYIWFYSNKENAVDRDLYRVKLDGTGFTRLTRGSGYHSVKLSKDGEKIIDDYSSIEIPPEVRLLDGKSGDLIKILDKANTAKLERYELSEWELFKVKCRDDFEIDVTLLRPTRIEKHKRYPVWMTVYTGPDLPTIRNRWNSGAYQQFLAQQGYGVMQVNVRSAGHHGHAISKCCYKALGQTELRDLEDAAKWAASLDWVDSSSLGITGYSYGGYITTYAMTHSKIWKLGIAGSGVYDWRGYDSVYTERYMSTPEDNPEGYEKASCYNAAKNLSGHLVLTHGTLDDNAHAQSTVKMAFYLQKAGKHFDMMLYPRQRHGFRDGDLRWHSREYGWRKMQEYLPAPKSVENR